MPKGMGYKTGGKHPGVPIASREDKPGTSFDVTASGAGMGTGYRHPNAKDDKTPGGHGSSGTASQSKAK